MAETLLTLGSYQFSMDTAAHDALQRSKTYRWATQQRLTREPASQYVGPGKETISIAGKIYPHFRGGLTQIQALRDEADRGEPLTLVDGRGNNLGQWCIKSIQDKEKDFVREGLPRCIEFSVALESYGPDASTGNGGGNNSGGGGFFNFLSFFA